jgi:hypothetical protein
MLPAPCPISHWIHTMYRCSSMPAWRACPLRGIVFIALALGLSGLAMAQVARSFPQNALRGEISFGQPPEVELNGTPARLAPGARIRNTANMIEMSAALKGQRAVVNYTLEAGGLVMDVWILRPEEVRRRPWPTTPEEARNWVFDPVAQTWSRR